MLTRKSLWLSCALLSVLVACTGSIEEPQNDGTEADVAMGGGGDAASLGGTSGSSGGGSDAGADTNSSTSDTNSPANDTDSPSDDTGNPPGDTNSPPTDTESPVADTGNPPGDTDSPADDTGNPLADTGNPPSDTSDPANDTGNPPSGECDRVGFTPEFFFAVGDATHANGYFAYSANLSELQNETYEQLLISFSQENGPEVSVYELERGGPADCELCVTASAGCTNEGGCEQTFIATEGRIGISRIGDGIGGTIIQAVFEEVTIDANGSSFVPDGDRWCMNSIGFEADYNVTVVEPTDPAECSAPDTCVGDTVPDFNLQSCETGDIVSFSSLNTGRGSLVVNAAGWCAACRAWTPQVLDMDIPGRGGNVIIALASDEDLQVPTLEYCREYARRYGSENLRYFYIDLNRRVRRNMHVYRYGLPWNAVVLSSGEYIHGDGYNGSTRPDAAIEQMLNGQ